MQQPYLYTLKVVGYKMPWSLHTWVLVCAVDLGQHMNHRSSASFPEPWAKHRGSQHLTQLNTRSRREALRRTQVLLVHIVPCHPFAQPCPAFLPDCLSASPPVTLIWTLDLETTACVNVPISLHNRARTNSIMNPLFYSIYRSCSSLIRPSLIPNLFALCVVDIIRGLLSMSYVEVPMPGSTLHVTSHLIFLSEPWGSRHSCYSQFTDKKIEVEKGQ